MSRSWLVGWMNISFEAFWKEGQNDDCDTDNTWSTKTICMLCTIQMSCHVKQNESLEWRNRSAKGEVWNIFLKNESWMLLDALTIFEEIYIVSNFHDRSINCSQSIRKSSTWINASKLSEFIIFHQQTMSSLKT